MVANQLLKWVNLTDNLEGMHTFREKTSSPVTGWIRGESSPWSSQDSTRNRQMLGWWGQSVGHRTNEAEEEKAMVNGRGRERWGGSRGDGKVQGHGEASAAKGLRSLCFFLQTRSLPLFVKKRAKTMLQRTTIKMTKRSQEESLNNAPEGLRSIHLLVVHKLWREESSPFSGMLSGKDWSIIQD